MLPDQSNSGEKSTDLQIQTGSVLARLPGEGSPALSEIMSRSIVHIQTSKALTARHRVGEHELCGPDYRLVCIWAEELRLTTEDVLERMLRKDSYILGLITTIVDGNFKRIVLDHNTLPISRIPTIAGLVVSAFHFNGDSKNPISNLNLSSFPDLKGLGYTHLHLNELYFPGISNLTNLFCAFNYELKEIDLSAVPNLTWLSCFFNRLENLNLSAVPNLAELNCSHNKLTGIELNAVPNLTNLYCEMNNLSELDIRALIKLEKLEYSPSTRIIQRSDQNF